MSFYCWIIIVSLRNMMLCNTKYAVWTHAVNLNLNTAVLWTNNREGESWLVQFDRRHDDPEPLFFCTVQYHHRNFPDSHLLLIWTKWAWYLSRYSNWLRAGRFEIESRWGRDFSPVQTGPGVHPASCKMDTGSSPGVKCDRGVLLTTHPLLVPRSWTSRAIPLPTLWATPGQ